MLKPVAPHKPTDRQLVLFPGMNDLIFKSANHLSPYLGDWAEEYLAKVTGGKRMTTHSGCLCPDLELGDQWYMEVKAAGPRNSWCMYKERYSKYLQLCRSGAKLQFAFVHHDVVAGDFVGRRLSNLRTCLALGVCHITIVPATTVFQEVRRRVRENGWGFCAGRKGPYQYHLRFGASFLDRFRVRKNNNYIRAFRTRVYDDDVGYVPMRLYKTDLPPGAPVGQHSASHQRAAGMMLEELHSSRHDVALSKLPDGRKVRVVQGRNVDWYEKMRRDHYKGRRGYSYVQRRNIIKALELMAQDRPVAPGVEERLLPYVDEWIEQQNTLDELDQFSG